MKDLLRPTYEWPDHAPKVVSTERRLVTVLFADIVDSTRLVLGVDPEEANDRLIPALNIMADLVYLYDGTLAQVLGDGVLALFGVPKALEEHVLHGCLAATEMHRSIAELSARVSIRVGLSSGEIIVEFCSNGECRPVGAAVHLAAKAQALAPAGHTVLTERTYTHVSQRVTARSYHPLKLSPHVAATPTFILEEVRSRERPLSWARQEPAPFVGRRKELNRLNTALRKAAGGQGTMLRIIGEAGIGKSRLIDQFIHQQPAAAFRIERCALQQRRLQNAFEAATGLLFRLLGMEVNDDTADVPDPADLIAAIEKIGVLRPAEIHTTLDVIGLGHRTSPAAEPQSKLRVAMRSIALIAAAVSQQKPLLFVLDDMHWSDTATQILVEELAKRVSEARILVVLSTRERPAEGAALLSCGSDVTLGPLNRLESRQIIQRIIGSRWHVNRDLLDLIEEKGQGNPFFMEECARVWLEQRSRDSKVNPARHPQAAHVIPETVHAVLAERIDALPHPARQLLLLMSVIGETVDFRTLQHVAANGLAVALAALPQLLASELISRTRILPQVEFRFRHALIRDVAYKTLPKSARQRIHSQVYQALLRQRQHTARAYHALQAERWREAFTYSHLAAKDAARSSRNREARDHYYGALLALDHLPINKRNSQRNVDLRISVASTLSRMGRHSDARKNLTMALRTARRLGDRKRSVVALSDVALRQWSDGRLPKASAASALAYRLALANGMTETSIQSSIRLGMILADRGDYRRAKSTLLEAIDLIPERQRFEPFGLLGVAISGAQASLAAVYGELGEFQEAFRIGDEALQTAEQSKHPFSLLYAATYIAHVLVRQGRFDSAVPLLERAIAICEETASEILFPLASSLLGYAYTQTGRSAGGILQMCDALESSVAQGLGTRRALGATWLADAYLRIGQTQRAAELANSALAVADRSGELGFKAWAHYTLGSIYLQQQYDERAGQEFAQAERLAKARGMKPLLTHSRFGRHRVDQHRGGTSTAEAENIVQSYQSMGMSHWAERAIKEFGLARPAAARLTPGLV